MLCILLLLAFSLTWFMSGGFVQPLFILSSSHWFRYYSRVLALCSSRLSLTYSQHTHTHTFSTLLRCWSLLLLQTILFQLMWVAREMKDRIINFGDSTTTCRRLRSRPQRDRPVAVAVERLVLVVVVQEGLMSQATTIMPPPQPPIAGAVALEPAKSAIQTSSPPHRRPRPWR